MGMLDEAIREHFDLMRRNGADPAVVAVQEREALGAPGEREARAARIAAERSGELAEEEVAAVVVVGEEPGAVAIVEHETGEVPAVEDEVAVEEQTAVTAADQPVGGVEAEGAEEAVLVEEEAAQETRQFTIEESQEAVMPPPATPPADPPIEPQEPPVSAPPADPAAEPAQDAGEDSQARDELEETPDFLEETPEHDRLWFERKPPRDFEF